MGIFSLITNDEIKIDLKIRRIVYNNKDYINMPRQTKCKVDNCSRAEHKAASNGKRCEGVINLDNGKVTCCDVRASFNYKNVKGALFCGDHMNPTMLNSQFKYCEYEDACVNKENAKGSKICKEHYNIQNNIEETPKPRKILAKNCHYKSIENGELKYTCNRGSNYNYKGLQPRYCKDHVKDISGKEPGGHISQMRNVRDTTCKFYIDDENDCIAIATCKINGIKMYCSEHLKEIETEEKIESSISKKKCKFEGCTITPSYGYKNENNKKIYLCCVSHINDVKHLYDGEIKQLYKECIFVSEDNIKCTERARKESEEGKRDIAYCYGHGKGLKDNSKKTCKYEKGCTNEATHNIKTEKMPLYCCKHAKLYVGMCSKKNITCHFESCTTDAYFNKYKGCYERFCAKHADDDMKNYISPICIGCDLIQIRHYDNMLCARCDPNGKKRVAEFAVYDLLTNNNINFIYNKYLKEKIEIIYRPDFVIKFDSIIVIIEVDENQHQGYNKDEEFKRMKVIYDHFKTKTAIIRFNPDEYKNDIDSFNPNLKFRLTVLMSFIKDLADMPDDDLNQLYYMFYDYGGVIKDNYIRRHNLLLE